MRELNRQKDRFLEVITPLGKEALFLTNLEGVETVSSSFEFHFTLCSKNSGLELSDLNCQPITAIINQSAGVPQYINGIINQWTRAGKNSQAMQIYHATIRPSYARLGLSVNCELFQNKTVPQIFTQVCQANCFYDFDLSQLKCQHGQREYCVQYNESNSDFLNRILAEEGIYYYFKHSQDKHIMMLSDQSSLSPIINLKGIYSNVPIDGHHIHDWRSYRKTQANKSASSDYHYQSPTQSLYQESENRVDKLIFINSSKVTRYYFPGNYENITSGKKIVSRIMGHESCHSYEINGSCDYPEFIPGERFRLCQHDDKSQIGEYFLLSVRHKAHDYSHLSHQYREEALAKSYLNYFIVQRAEFNFIPALSLKKPIIKSIQNAVVMGPKEKIPYTDKMGRVKVKFFWNRNGEQENQSSCWIRVAQMWSGAKRGLQFIPRVGDEVSLSFEYGNPDRPVINGTFYNGKNELCYHLPQEQVRSSIRTHTIGSEDSLLFNDITFDDSKQQENFIINAAKELNVSVMKNEVVDITKNKEVKIADNLVINAYKTLTHTSSREINISARKGRIVLKPCEIEISGVQVLLGKAR